MNELLSRGRSMETPRGSGHDLEFATDRFPSIIERTWVDTGVLPNLATDHRVIAFDLRGHGKSDKPHEPRAYNELAQDAVRLLDHLGIAQAHIVGYSFGAVVVAKLLTTDAHRLLTATLGGASPRRELG
jgi:pimeloyl-ACP methyl ester carboxylesterase